MRRIKFSLIFFTNFSLNNLAFATPRISPFKQSDFGTFQSQHPFLFPIAIPMFDCAKAGESLIPVSLSWQQFFPAAEVFSLHFIYLLEDSWLYNVEWPSSSAKLLAVLFVITCHHNNIDTVFPSEV